MSMIVTLRGKIEPCWNTTSAASSKSAGGGASSSTDEPIVPSSPEECPTSWKWTGQWFFGTTTPSSASGSSSSGKTPTTTTTSSTTSTHKPPPPPLPFAYTWERAESPHNIPVPSLMMIAPQVSEDVDDDRRDDRSNQDVGTRTTNDAPEKATTMEDASSSRTSVAHTTPAPPAAALSSTDGTNKEQKEDPSNPTDDATATTNKANSNFAGSAPNKSKKQQFITMADKIDPNDNDENVKFTEAHSQANRNIPLSGHWKGSFDTIVNQKTKSTAPVHEQCYICFNATPSKNAKIGFGDELSTSGLSTTTAATATTTIIGSPKPPLHPVPLLPHGHVHVRGRGENQYGTFELIGSFNVDTMVLEVQRKYIVIPTHPSSSADNKASSKLRRSRDRHLMDNLPLESGNASADTNRPYFTRKRPMSWKRKAAEEEEQAAKLLASEMAYRAAAKRRAVSLGPNGISGPAMKRPRSDSGSGSTAIPLTAPPSNAVGTVVGVVPTAASQPIVGGTSAPRLTVAIPGNEPPHGFPTAISTTPHLASVGILNVPRSGSGGVPTQSLGPPSSAMGDPFAALHLPTNRPVGDLITPTNTSGSKKKFMSHSHLPRLTIPGGGNRHGPPPHYVSAASAAVGAAASMVSPLTLPTVGDPHKARWRAAHFLYYHRNDLDDSSSVGVGVSNHATVSTALPPPCVVPSIPLIGQHYAPTPNAPSSSGGGNTPTSANLSAYTTANNNTSSSNQHKNAPKYVVYEGDMLHSHRDGRGVCLYSNGLLYEGTWKRDKEHGYGILMTADRKFVLYKGDWERGKMHGIGTYYYYSNGDNHHKQRGGQHHQPQRTSKSSKEQHLPRYEGEFKENLRHGNGTYYLKDGSVYVGSWLNNVMSGRGVFTWSDGSVYDGDWKDGKRHGQGVLRASDGFSYDGNWSMNSMEGRGSATYPNGQQYIGLFTAGRREGRGTMLFTNGAIYEGRFRDDAVDGQGTLRLSRSLVVPRSERVDEENEENEEATETNIDDEDGKDDFMIPVSFQSDIGNIHRKAGFTIGGD